MVDLTPYKISIFPNINDLPLAPSASVAGNGSHIINRINALIDALNIELESLQQGGNGGSSNGVPGITYDSVGDAILIDKYTQFSNRLTGNKLSVDGSQRQLINITLASGLPNVNVVYEDATDTSSYTVGAVSGESVRFQKHVFGAKVAEVKLSIAENDQGITPSLSINDTQVVGVRQPAISNPTPDLSELTTATIAILECLRAHGLIGIA